MSNEHVATAKDWSRAATIEDIKDSPFDIDSEGEYGLDDFLKADLPKEGAVPLSEYVTEIIKALFVQVPLNMMGAQLLNYVITFSIGLQYLFWLINSNQSITLKIYYLTYIPNFRDAM